MKERHIVFSYDNDRLLNDAQLHSMNTLHKIINYIYIYKIVVIMNIFNILHHAICASYTNPPIHLNSARLITINFEGQILALLGLLKTRDNK